MNKERHIYIGIIIFLIATLATTLVLFTQFNNETWHEVATTFIFPFINAIVGAIIVTVVGTIIANKVLETTTSACHRPFQTCHSATWIP